MLTAVTAATAALQDEEEAEEVPGEAQGSRSNGVPEPAPSPSVPSTRAGVARVSGPPVLT